MTGPPISRFRGDNFGISSHNCFLISRRVVAGRFIRHSTRSMALPPGAGKCRRKQKGKLAATLFLFLGVGSCAVARPSEVDDYGQLRATAGLIAEVKAFGKTLGIEPTEALSRTAREAPALSMMWLWLQRVGTLALRAPIDIRMAIGFATAKEQLKLEQVYRIDGYSVYYRQGNEFADPRSVTTVGFADEGFVRTVKVVLHEDLHGDKNFDLPWEIEESIVTPLGSLGAVEFFRHTGDDENLERALMSLEEERVFSRDLNALIRMAEGIFAANTPEEANRKILALMPSFPNYHRVFQRQISGQHPPTVLEAKLSHDLAYYRYHDQIVSLHEKARNLRRLIEDLKMLHHDATVEDPQKYLRELDARYSSTTN